MAGSMNTTEENIPVIISMKAKGEWIVSNRKYEQVINPRLTMPNRLVKRERLIVLFLKKII